MKETYIEFELVLGNRQKCNVRYFDEWSCSLFGNRTVHFEFRDSLTVSHTGYRSEFRIVAKHEKINPERAAKEIIEGLTGIKFSGENVQKKLL